MYAIRITRNRQRLQSRRQFKTKTAANRIVRQLPSSLRPAVVKVTIQRPKRRATPKRKVRRKKTGKRKKKRK